MSPDFAPSCSPENSDSDLSMLLNAERRGEAVRARAHAREASRFGGVAWSGFAPEPFRPRSEAQLRREAAGVLARRRAWRASGAGQVLGAAAAVQQAAEAAHAAAESMRAALNRNADGELGRCAQDAAEIMIQAQALLDAAKAARWALAQAADAGPFLERQVGVK